MSELFDYEKCEKNKQDAFAVIGDAIRKRYTEEKIPVNLARTMAAIIDDGFLDCVLEESRKLIRHNENRLHELEFDAKRLDRRDAELQCHIACQERELANLEEKAQAFQDEIVNETDPLLIGAKKAYHFIESKTGEEKLAAKAFNSYLL